MKHRRFLAFGLALFLAGSVAAQQRRNTFRIEDLPARSPLAPAASDILWAKKAPYDADTDYELHIGDILLDLLSDVVAPSPSTGDALVFDGDNWVPAPVEGVLGNYVLAVADGTGIDGTASGPASTYTPIFDSTEVNVTTWGDGTAPSGLLYWFFDVDGTPALNPRFLFSQEAFSVLVGTLDATLTFGGAAEILHVDVDGNNNNEFSITNGAFDVITFDPDDDFAPDWVMTGELLYAPAGGVTGPALIDEPSQFANPTLLPNRNDVDTGVASQSGVNLVDEGVALLWAEAGEVAVDNRSIFRLDETNANGSNYKGFRVPASVTVDTICDLEDDASFIPDSCVGDGGDDDTPESDDFGSLTAGRSLTIAAGTIDADQELYEATKCINVDPAHTTTNWIFFKAERALTIIGIDCLVDAATSVVMTPRECDADGANCSDIEAAITCGTTNTTEATSVDNASIDAGDWVRVTRGTLTGSATQASMCLHYTVAD